MLASALVCAGLVFAAGNRDSARTSFWLGTGEVGEDQRASFGVFDN